MRRLSWAAALLFLSASAFALETGDNPDRWPTFQLGQGAQSSFKGDQINVNRLTNDDHNRRTLNVNLSGEAWIPLSNSFTVDLGAGGVWNEQETSGSVTSGSNFNDSTLATYLAGVRYYFEGSIDRPWGAGENPDRWPSLALTFSGSDVLSHSTGNANIDTGRETANDLMQTALDARVPVSEAWTLTAIGWTNRQQSATAATPTATGGRTSTRTAGGGVGFRYFLVGRNLITADSRQNPDRWIMFWGGIQASGTYYGLSTVTNQAGDLADRDTRTRSYQLLFGVRAPITDHCSLSFNPSLQYQRSDTPFLPQTGTNGALTRTSSIAFNAAIRYFLF